MQLGYTPLHQAAQQGQANAVRQLLKHRADPNALTAVSLFLALLLRTTLFLLPYCMCI